MVTSMQSMSVKLYIGLVIILTLIVIFSSYARYLFTKDYNFLIEAPCDPATEKCQIRDCEDYCPPNELAIYKTYLVKAEHFEKCTDNTCTNICQSTQTASLCKLIPCDEEETECSGVSID